MSDALHHTSRPPWAPLTLVAFVGLVICTNVAGVTWAKLLESSPETLLLLSSRNRYLALALGADVSPAAYWLLGTLRITAAFVVCHLIGRAYADDALRWFVKYLGVTPEALDQFNRGFARAEWVIVPFFAGSNIVAALSGVHRTPWRRLAVLLAVGIGARLALIWWLARVFDDELTDFLSWLQRYSWWAVGISVVLVVLVNLRNFRRGAAR
jgi:membrane protein DedA with SNARE-associated domain